QATSDCRLSQLRYDLAKLRAKDLSVLANTHTGTGYAGNGVSSGLWASQALRSAIEPRPEAQAAGIHGCAAECLLDALARAVHPGHGRTRFNRAGCDPEMGHLGANLHPYCHPPGRWTSDRARRLPRRGLTVNTLTPLMVYLRFIVTVAQRYRETP